MVDGHLYCETHRSRKARLTVTTVQSVTGMASGCLVKRSTHVRMYTNPREGGNGPTRSKCTCENRKSGAGHEPRGLR
ncbi:unnamed protein product, partial [Dicrocoelium dendriticum]